MAAQTAVDTSHVVSDVLADLPVTKEATTSRLVLNNPLMRVVYFSFDTGQELTDHASPRAVVITLLTGVMDVTVGTATHRVVAGDAVYLAPGEQHALVAIEPTQLSLVMVDTDA